MPKLHATLEPGDQVLIPEGGSITFIEKSGRRSRVVIESAAPVTVAKAGEQRRRVAAPPVAPERVAG